MCKKSQASRRKKIKRKLKKEVARNEFNRDKFERDYFSMKNDELCVKYGISHNTLRRLAKKEGWEKPHGRPEIKLV